VVPDGEQLGVAGAKPRWPVRGEWGAGGVGEQGRMKKWIGSGGIDKLGAYVAQPRPRNIRTHLMFLSFLVWLRNISHYVP
jgi:hypothetical protein